MSNLHIESGDVLMVVSGEVTPKDNTPLWISLYNGEDRTGVDISLSLKQAEQLKMFLNENF